MILGCDAAGIDAGRQRGGGLSGGAGRRPIRRGFSILSEQLPGHARRAGGRARGNLVPKPAELSFIDAACLPTAWLTAYRMLTTKGRVDEADAVLVQGAGGGVATAAVVLAQALGKRVYATSRDAGQAGADRRAGRDRAGAGRAAARAGGRGHRDGRRGHLRPLDEVRRAGRPHRGLRRDRRASGHCGPAPASSRCSWRSSGPPWVRAEELAELLRAVS